MPGPSGDGGGFGGAPPSGSPTFGDAGDAGVSGNDAVNAGASGSDTGGNADGQDGQICCTLTECLGSGTQSQLQFPDGLPPVANYSLIGVRPHDLGAMLRAGGRVPTPGFDEGGALQFMALAETPMTHRHGYGASFAVGYGGTVAPSSGAFVHPFTLLTLPAAARRMGLALELQYLSNAQHATGDALPFGPGYVLSGHDLLLETVPGTSTLCADVVTIARGDGLPAKYTLVAGPGPVWSYSAPFGIYDFLTAEIINTKLTYTRTLRDGRKIVYDEHVALAGSNRYVRSRVQDDYGNQIQYAWQKTNGIAYLQTITDTRGVQVVFSWDTQTPKRVIKVAINPATVQLVPAVAASDLAVDLAYTADGARLLQRIQWFTTRVVADADADGSIDPGENSLLRPTIDLVYEAYGKLGEVWNSTRVPSTRQIQNVYQLHSGYGVRVVTQREGGSGTAGLATHTYSYPDPTQRLYVDPRGTLVNLALDGERRVRQVIMVAQAGGMPRNEEQPVPVTPADHAQLGWTVAYGCCGLPEYIREDSSGRVWTFQWSQNFLLEVKVNGTWLHRFDQTHGRLTSWRVCDDTTDRLTVAYSAYGPSSLAYSSVTLTTPGYTDARGVSRGPATATLTFGPQGHLTQTQRSGLGTSLFSYVATGAGHGLLQTITGPAAGAALAVTYTCDDLGRLSAMHRGLAGGVRTTNVVVDTHDRVQSVNAQATTGGPFLVSETSYDEFGDVSWTRSENRDEAGNLRTRPWIQSIAKRDELGRVVKRYRDSALVTAPQEELLLTQMTWAADHRLASVQGHNGAITSYVFDGYGFLYRTIVDSGGLGLETPRYFYDTNGLVVLARNKLNHELLIERHGATTLHAGLVHKVFDPANLNQLWLTYDTHRRLHQTSLATRITELRYDGIGQLDRVGVRALGSALESSRIHVYDDVGRLTELGQQADSADIDPASGYKRGFIRAFDGYGRMTYQRDRLSDHTGQPGGLWNQVSFAYHALTGLPLKMIEREIEQAASEFGPLTASGNHTVHTYETHLQHDLLDRVVQVDQKPEGVGLVGPSVQHNYYHDSLDNLVRFDDALGAKLRWVFDGLGDVRRRTLTRKKASREVRSRRPRRPTTPPAW